MRISFTNRIRLYMIILFMISFISSVIILNSIMNSSNLKEIVSDTQNVLYIMLFFQFLITILGLFYMPVYVKNALIAIRNVIQEIGKGNYHAEFLNTMEEKDHEFLEIYQNLIKMQEVILHFDNLKKEKIVEHRNRILGILGLTDDGFIITSIKGDISFVNDSVEDYFPHFKENLNLTQINMTSEFEQNLKRYILKIVKSKSKIPTEHFFFSTLNRNIILRNAIVRDSRGIPIGIIVSLANLGKVETKHTHE